MFNILLEISDPALLRLTDMQRSVLLTIFIAQTPELAYDAATGSEHIIEARDFLVRNSLITASSNKAETTSRGYDVLVANGLIDEQDNVTEQGKRLSDWFEKEKQQVRESLIPYRFLKQLV
jgi:hypothetical protein